MLFKTSKVLLQEPGDGGEVGGIIHQCVSHNSDT